MPVLIINNVEYNYNNDGVPAYEWAQAIVNGMLQKAGGDFTLTADVDFGPNFGIKSLYYKSRSSDIASDGNIRLAREDVIAWRNEANSADLFLYVDDANDLYFNGVAIGGGGGGGGNVTGPLSSTDGTIARFDGVTGMLLKNSPTTISNSDIDAAAAIALSKLAAVTASRVLVSDGSGAISASSVTSTTLGYLDATSSIQTQLNSKQATGNYITALTGDVTASGPGSVASTIANNAVTTAKINDNAVDKDKINPDVAGSGLGQNVDGSLEVNVDDSTIEINTDILRVKDSGISTAKIANDAVDKDKINADIAGNGLGQNVSGALEVNVDDSTIEINTDSLRVKSSGITTTQLADDSVDKNKIAADVAGSGLGQNVDGSLEVNVDGSTIEINTDTLRVKDSGISTAKIANDAVDKDKIAADVAGSGIGQNVDGSLEVNVDGSTIEINTDALRVKDSGISTAKIANDAVDKDKIAADVAGSGLGQNVDGSLEVKVDDSTIEINTDTLRVKDSGITNAKVATGIDAAKLADGTVSNTEFQYINSLTSNAQTQIDALAKKVDIQVFTSSGTWNKPSGAALVEVICIGGGGGGRGGEKMAAGASARGGGAGGSAGMSMNTFPASSLGSSVSVTVGAAGASGPGATTNSTTGSSGTAGGDSYFSTYVYAGGGGTPAGSAVGGVLGRGFYEGVAGAAGGDSAVGGSIGSTAAELRSSIPGAGGGGLSSGGTQYAGGSVTNFSGTNYATANGGSGGGVAGDDGVDGLGLILLGQGGAGGGASTSGNGGAGGDGGNYGAGGGGGGAARNDVGNGGAGGTGGDGVVVVITWF